MAASLPIDIHPIRPTLPESSRSDELTLAMTKKHTATSEQPSEAAADNGSHDSGQTQSTRDPISESQECSEILPFNSEAQGQGFESAIATVVGKEAVIHPETSCVEEDVCEGCGRSRLEEKRLLKLEKEVRRLEEKLREKEDIIARLWEENATKTAELLEFQLQKLQRSISDKDSAIAVLEHQQQSSEGICTKGLEKLKGERGKLTKQLKSKVQERVDLFRKDSDKALDSLANQFQSYNKEQVCGVLRALELTCVRLKSYIDQLLAVVLESNPNLLEGMPRIQQSTGMKLELFRMASLQELLEELHEKEQNCQSLQDYAGLLLERITEQSPSLLESISSHQKQCNELLMAEQ